MSSQPRERGKIPPMEIGSFVALQPDKSEFIGSASGVFFANTVFRAFAASSSEVMEGSTGEGVPTPNTGSAHYMMAPENAPDQRNNAGCFYLDPDSASGSEGDDVGSPSYGTSMPDLGKPPSLDQATRLLMAYFQHVHPFFPFLHGPTLLGQVSQIYKKPYSAEDKTSTAEDDSKKVCRAVTFQCIFNIAASFQSEGEALPPQSRIRSSRALMDTLGAMSCRHDILSIQAILAMELYLMTRMSFRPASSVHGSLTRMVYHAGLHRCPFRYVQLPRHSCEIRQRIFWCVYVLDRQLSQALGHPVAIRDEEVDVCIPCMAELHLPVKPHDESRFSQTAAEDEVREHLPRDVKRSISLGVYEGTDPSEASGTSMFGSSSPAYHNQETAGGVERLVSGYLATYYQLLGAAMDLFHRSIHHRSVSWDRIPELTCKIHSWWNSLPMALQNDPSADDPVSSQYSVFFAILYHYLILFINRPFLSLPTTKMDFRSSLQSGLGASRAIVKSLQYRERAPLLKVWPVFVSAAWMAGLVIAYASLLELYPLDKATADLQTCLSFLEAVSVRWSSANHCHGALKMLLARLTAIRGTPSALEALVHNERLQDTNQAIGSAYYSRPIDLNEGPSGKRRKGNSDNGILNPNQIQSQSFSFPFGIELPDLPGWQPVFEYTGFDFGFGSDQTGPVCGGSRQTPGAPDQQTDSTDWDSYLQSLPQR